MHCSFIKVHTIYKDVIYMVIFNQGFAFLFIIYLQKNLLTCKVKYLRLHWQKTTVTKAFLLKTMSVVLKMKFRNMGHVYKQLMKYESKKTLLTALLWLDAEKTYEYYLWLLGLSDSADL